MCVSQVLNWGWAWKSLAAIAIASTSVLAEEPLERSGFLRFEEPRTTRLYDRERFPNVVVATDGSVLAFWNGVVCRRSTDGGETWGEPTSIATGFMGGGVIVDEQTGKIWVFIEQGHPPSPQQIFVSTDHGQTWDLSTSEILPNALNQRPSFHMNEHGIMLQRGEHAGRLIRPSRWYGNANYPPENFPTHTTNALYSDDRGLTWKASEPLALFGVGEAAIVELWDGNLLYNTRRHWAPAGVDPRRRWTATSRDGGVTWENVRICPALPDGDQDRDYGLMAGLIRLPIAERDVLIFSNIDSPQGRRNGTVWVSFDGGETWPVKRLITQGAFGYSSLAAGKFGTASQGLIYLLYEDQGGGSLTQLTLGWLIQGQLTGDGEIPAEFRVVARSE